jgi:hypothetical protein
MDHKFDWRKFEKLTKFALETAIGGKDKITIDTDLDWDTNTGRLYNLHIFIIINGTGDDADKIKKIKERLEQIGYDTHMVVVNTADEVSKQRNIERGQRGGRTVPEKIRKQKDGEYVIVDLQKDLNLPVVIEYKRGTGFEVRVKTIMRKKNFMTTNQKVTVESFKSHISKL